MGDHATEGRVAAATRLARRRDVVAATVDGELVLFDPRSSRAHWVNGTGAWIWRRLDGRRGLDALAREMHERHAVGRREARADIRRFVRALNDLGLLNPCR